MGEPDPQGVCRTAQPRRVDRLHLGVGAGCDARIRSRTEGDKRKDRAQMSAELRAQASADEIAARLG